MVNSAERSCCQAEPREAVSPHEQNTRDALLRTLQHEGWHALLAGKGHLGEWAAELLRDPIARKTEAARRQLATSISRVYKLGFDQFSEWFALERRPAFTKATVSA